VDALVAGVAAHGYAIVPCFLSAAAVDALRERAEAAFAGGRMTLAAIGRGGARQRDATVRGDAILWLDEATADATECALLATLDEVRRRVNEALFAGLWDFEGHYARYPAGAGYARHVDRFRDQDTRVLSFVLYLNPNWQADAGGALRLHVEGDESIDVQPIGGTAVAFLADVFAHEVLPATRPRWSFTGWFRRRPA
jgi:SM-20-related protein